jgi:hypothetical protein
MSRTVGLTILTVLCASAAVAQENTPAPEPEKRSWVGRLFHGASSEQAPNYKDARLRGLLVKVEVAPQPVKLSEIRQLEVRTTLTNVGKRAVELQFRTDQRIEVYLRNTDEKILTTWSDNHAFAPKPGTVLVNPREHLEYNETIATRDLTPNKVFIAEVFFPEFPELIARQKFLTAP